jgi:hypothetical protein
MSQRSADEFIYDEITAWSQMVTDELRQSLRKRDPFLGDSDLAQSIYPEVKETNVGFEVTIHMNNYWRWINDKRGRTTNNGTGQVRKGLEGVSGWVAKRGIAVRLVQKVLNKQTGKYYTRKFKSSAEWNKSMAYAISRKIHSKGFVSKGRGFYDEVINDDTINELVQTIATKYGEVFVAEIVSE